MKRLIALLLAFVVFALPLSSLADIDLTVYTKEELLELISKINQRIIELNSKSNLVYEDKEVSIQWLGWNTDFSYAKHSLLITNKTDKSLFYCITDAAYNNIQVSLSNSFMSIEIKPGMSYITSSNNASLADIKGLEIVGIKDVNDIHSIYLEVSFYNSAELFNSSVIKTVDLRFSLPME